MCAKRNAGREKKNPNLFLLSFSSFITLCASSRPWQKKQMMFKKQNLQVHEQETRQKEKQEQEYIGEAPGW
jgi:hypothetical protein